MRQYSLDRRTWLSLLFILTLSAQANTAEKPNIVIIVADDVGYGDISYYNKNIADRKSFAQTPSIDALAEGGMWFTDAHSPAALCSPSRYAIMSGNDPLNSYMPRGVWSTLKKNAIGKNDLTLGRVAQAAGYTTGFVGKWHLGGTFYKNESTTPYVAKAGKKQMAQVAFEKWIEGHPRELGFHYDFTLPSGVQGPYNLAYENGEWFPLSQGSTLVVEKQPTKINEREKTKSRPGIRDSAWSPEGLNPLLAAKAKAFINEAARKPPFLLVYWSPAVHVPHTPPAKWGDRALAGSTLTPHLDMVETLDKEVDTIINALKNEGVYNNTLIIFTSDNGGLRDSSAEKAGHYSPGRLRGAKGGAYEGGHRVPFIISWPGHTTSGSFHHALISGADLVATLADLLQVSVGAHQARDSWSFLPLIKFEEGARTRSEMLIQSSPKLGRLAYRHGKWKLIFTTSRRFDKLKPEALYHLTENPREDIEKNLLRHHDSEDRVAAMTARATELVQRRLRSAVPTN